MLSVVIPTRKRPKILQNLIDSLFDNKHGEIEVLVVKDLDDNSPSDTRIRLYSVPRMDNISYYTNYLAKRSRGSHILSLNDDTIVKTKDYDKIIKETLCDIIDYGYPSLGTPNRYSWPIITQQAYRNLGFIFHPKWKSHGADVHLNKIFSGAGIGKSVPIEVVHLSHHYKLAPKDETAAHAQEMSNWAELDTMELGFDDVEFFSQKVMVNKC